MNVCYVEQTLPGLRVPACYPERLQRQSVRFYPPHMCSLTAGAYRLDMLVLYDGQAVVARYLLEMQ